MRSIYNWRQTDITQMLVKNEEDQVTHELEMLDWHTTDPETVAVRQSLWTICTHKA